MADYTHQDIKVLDEITHIRTSPGMYIRETTTPTHLLEEVLDNSLDECFGKHATIVAVMMDTKNREYAVLDNGRGIPYENDVPITISNKLFSGSKFKGSKTAYDVASGLHGIGLVAVNALSDTYSIEIYRNGHHAIFEFDDCKLKNKKIEKVEATKPYSTKVRFKPSKKFFDNCLVDTDRIRKRLLIASVEFPNVHFVLNIDGNKEIIKIDKDEFFKKTLVNETDDMTEIVSFGASEKSEKFEITFCYTANGTLSPKVISSVNLLPVDGGGTHVNIFFDLIKDFFSDKAKKTQYKFQPSDVLYGLRAYVAVDLVTTEFSSQSKERLTTKKEYFEKLLLKLKREMEGFFIKNPTKLDSFLQVFHDYRSKIEAKKHKEFNTSGKRYSTKFTKLRDCISSAGELFVCEGDSAAGSLIQARDVKIHAVLPLRGKIPNALNAKDILKNEEMGEMIQAIGTGVGQHFDISKIKYSKIICATDADADGAHIFSLMTLVLAIILPDVIKEGHFYYAEMPLYCINEKKLFKPLWTPEELSEARKNGHNITRLKGLGELNPWQLKICLLDEKTRRLRKINYSSNFDRIVKLFSNIDEKRKLLEGGFKI